MNKRVEPAVATDATPDMSSEAGRENAREAQSTLTASVGQRLTREDRDSQVPRWKRWLGKG